MSARLALPLLLLAVAAGPATKKPMKAARKIPTSMPDAGLPAKAPPAPVDAPTPEKTLSLTHPAKAARCGACHSTAGWTEVKFNHERTGFPLEGRHARITCVLCHPVNFEAPVPRSCAGCHEDPHAGDLGGRCEACHEETGWRSNFTGDDHRRTGFPLLGAHAAVPCLECHPDSRERRFSRPVVDCAGCHRSDQQQLTGTPLDHATLGFGTDCATCHGPVRFSPATFPAHDSCFVLSRGSHAGIGCLKCHTELPAVVAIGACSTHTESCTGCHAHTCAGPGSSLETDKQHAAVLGYQCKDRKCYECHQAGQVAP